MGRNTIKQWRHLHNCLMDREILLEDPGAIRFGKGCLGKWPANLAAVNVKCGDDFNISRSPRANGLPHDTG
jgi:hypothetical protein